jgi:hypothetical protein
VPKGAKRIGARIGKDFVTFVEGVTIGYNEELGKSLTPAEGLRMILDANVDPTTMFEQYRGFAEQTRTHIILKEWAGEAGFKDGWKWMTPEFVRWFIWRVLDKPYKIDDFREFKGAPELRKVLLEHRNGEVWVIRFVATLRDFLYPSHSEDVETSKPAQQKTDVR